MPCAAAPVRGESPATFYAPPQFDVTRFADDDLAHNIHSLTIDNKGRVVVAGPGYVRILLDTDGDGKADQATLFSDVPRSGAHGMYFDGNDLICTGDNAVMRLFDKDGDGRADNADKPEIWAKLGHSDHGANGIVKGPDGWFYVACGNDAGVTDKHVTLPGSPVTKPNMGAIVRFSPDGKHSDVYAHGFRNPYDLALNAQGHLFTVDSDGERDQYLPWYSPTRLFDVAQGKHHGWMLAGWQRSWNRPAYFPDNVERLAEIGRGSPTGVVCYQHTAFPARYRNGVFSLCWTLGQVYFFPMEPWGATYKANVEVFLRANHDAGFNPVDMEVGPKGDLFIAVGGRGTRGGVYRVSYTRLPARPGVDPDAPPDPAPKGPPSAISLLLSESQPLNSWSRAHWVGQAKRLGRDAFVEAVLDEDLTEAQRARAVEILVEVFDGVTADLTRRALDLKEMSPVEARSQEPPIVELRNPLLASRFAWALTKHARTDSNARQFLSNMEYYTHAGRVLTELTYAQDAGVVLAALDCLATLPDDYRALKLPPDWRTLGATDRRVRAAAIAFGRLLMRDREDANVRPIEVAVERRQRARSLFQNLGVIWAKGLADSTTGRASTDSVDALTEMFTRTVSADVHLDIARLLQVALGDIHHGPSDRELDSGYTANSPDRLEEVLRNRVALALIDTFPKGDSNVDRELARLMAMLRISSPAPLPALTAKLTPVSPVEDDLHYLFVLAQLSGERDARETQTTAAGLNRLHRKLAIEGGHTSRNWPLRVGEVFDALCERDPGLAAAVVKDESFGQPEHSMFVARMKGAQRESGAMVLLGKATVAGDPRWWNSDMVNVVASLPREIALPALRRQWANPMARDAIVSVLEDRPMEADRAHFVEALDSPDATVVERAAVALVKLKAPGGSEEVTAAMLALRLACGDAKQSGLRAALADLLTHWSGRKLDAADAGEGDNFKAYQPWFDWFAQTHPDAARRLAASGADDLKAWFERFDRIDFSQGDAARGKAVFESRGCHLCHVASGRLGPDLAGVTRRLSRRDLFTAMVDPSREVAPLYRVQRVTTKSGQTYDGIAVYASPAATILQTGPATSVRITADNLAESRPTRQSLMPAGLLNGLTDEQTADLDAYLRVVSGN